MYVYIVIEDDIDGGSNICGVYSNPTSATVRKTELETKNQFTRFFSYRIEKVPIWD